MRRIVDPISWFLAGLTLGLFAASLWTRRESVTLISFSPDEAVRVHMVEVGVWIDRNFHVRLERRNRCEADSMRTVFRSPDEGRPVGSERVVWSDNSTRFVLLERHFKVNDGARLADGEVLYLMYDVTTNELRCNAIQQSEYRAFTLWDLPPMRWGGPPREGDDSIDPASTSPPRTNPAPGPT